MIYSRIFRARRLLYLLALLCMTLMTAACMKTPMFVCHPNYFDVQGKEAMAKEILRLEKVIEEAPENSKKPGPYLHLAILYSHYNNPAPNYPRSLRMFEKFLVLDPDSLENGEVLYMKTLVEALVETDRKRVQTVDKAGKLRRKNKRLKDENAKIVEENKELKDAIEKLKLLELMLEEKRLNLK